MMIYSYLFLLFKLCHLVRNCRFIGQTKLGTWQIVTFKATYRTDPVLNKQNYACQLPENLRKVEMKTIRVH